MRVGGGEEFTIILPNTSLTNALAQANALKDYISTHPVANIQLTISIGVATISSDDSVISVLERADSALYEAKNNGRNSVYFSDNKLTIIASASLL